MFNFEKLETWQEAIEFADLVYTPGSRFEVVSQSFIGRNQRFLKEEDFKRLYAAAEKQGKMLSGLRASLVNQRAND